MPSGGPPVILARSDLTLHRAPPTSHTRDRTPRPHSLKTLPEEWAGTGSRSTPPGPPNDVTVITDDTDLTDVTEGDIPEVFDMSLRRQGSAWSRHGSTRSHPGFIWSRNSSIRSTQSSIWSRQGSTRSYQSSTWSRYGSTRSRRSTWSRTSSRLRRSLREKGGPLYREALTQARSARLWAGSVKRRVVGGGGAAPLLTPAGSRRQPTVVTARGEEPHAPARNSSRVRAAHRVAAEAARNARWEASSGLAALLECSAVAGGAAAAAVARGCAAVVSMADAKIQQLRRSISSWSLSTIKKPKITIPKFSGRKLNIFGGRKNRVDHKDEVEAVEDVKLALLRVEGEGSTQGTREKEQQDDGEERGGERELVGAEVGGQVIHEPKRDTIEAQPTIVLTLHDRETDTPIPPPPSPSPGLLGPSDDIEFIDSDEAEADDMPVGRTGRNTMLDYSDKWFDARGTLTRSREDLSQIANDYDNCRTSQYYDATDHNDSAKAKEVQEVVEKNTTEPKGSRKAREWVRSFNEDSERRVERWFKKHKGKDPSDIPKSKSEIRLDELEDPPSKWTTRDEIQLNSAGDDEAYSEYLRREYNARVNMNDEKQKKNDEKVVRKESLKKIFEVRGKLSIKSIIDTQKPAYADTDIYIASTPYALSTSSGTQSDTPLNVSEDGINCTSSVDLDPAIELHRDSPGISVEAAKKAEATTQAVKDKEQEQLKEINSLNHKLSPSVPDVIIDSPGIKEQEPQIMKEQPHEATRMTKDESYTETNVHTESLETNTEDSTLQEVTWTEDESIKNLPKNPLYEDSDIIINDHETSQLSEGPVAECSVNHDESKESEYPNKKHENPEELKNTANVIISKKKSSPDYAVPNRKKKMPVGNIQKSIKNFAGSLFSQSLEKKGKKDNIEEKDADKKKKKSRLSPFNKDHLFKASSKASSEDSVSERQSNPRASEINKLPDNEDEEELSDNNPFSVEAMESPEKYEAGGEYPNNVTEAVNEHTRTNLSESIPDLLPSSEMMSSEKDGTHGGSSDSLVFFSQADSDEQKSLSHESSPGYGNPFVEEDGMKIRRDALLAVQAMDTDDTSTHYYSFLSATDGYHTPVSDEDRQKEDKYPPILPPKKIRGAEHIESILKSGHNKSKDSAELLLHKADENVQSKTMQKKFDEQNTVNEKLLQGQSTDAPVPSPRGLGLLPQQPTSISSTVVSPETNLSEQIPIIAKEPVPLEVPKLKLGPTLSLENQEPPKPSPRTKKGKGCYSSGAVTPTTPSAPTLSNGTAEVHIPQAKANVAKSSQINSPFNAVDGTMVATYPRRKTPNRQATATATERKSGDSGYDGPGSTYYGSDDSEPIYWEISETKGAPPRPSPRAKKGTRTPSETSLAKTPTSTTSPSSVVATLTTSSSQIPPESKPMPEWINNRAPIPSPRTKKQRSLQSLPTVVPTDDTMEAVKKKLQSMSSSPLPKATTPQKVPTVTSGEEFYSGKAASIAYGFSSGHTGVIAPPSPPMRSRKASQMSLPSAMAAEDTMSRQQKHRSLHGASFAVRGSNINDAPRMSSMRRSRRRTDPTHGITSIDIKSVVQTEELLEDVLYSVHSLMGASGGGEWAVTTGQAAEPPQKRILVNLDQVTQDLQSAFQVTPDTLDRLTQQAKTRTAPEVNLHLVIREAKDLRPKTVTGKTNAYATMSISGSSSPAHNTRVAKNTLSPIWNQDFILRVNNLQKDSLKIEVWHEHDHLGVQQLTAVRNIKSFSRLVKGTTAQAQHHATHLLGQVILSLKEVSERGMDNWYSLSKTDTEVAKDRGSILVKGHVSTTSQLHELGRRSYDALLVRLLHHHLTTASNNNQEEEWLPPWNGRLSSSSSASLAQHAIMLGLSEPVLQLSWWCVGVRVATVDVAWTLSQLHRVQAALAKGSYEGDDLEELRASFAYYVRTQAERLKNLHTVFPPSSGVLAQHQLTFTLKALQSLQSHAESRELLDNEGLPHIHEVVSSSLAIHAKNWWTLLVEEQLRGVRTADEQISRVVTIVAESNTFLSHTGDFYNSVLMKEMNIPYMQTTYLMVTKKVNPCVRPLLMNIYNRMPALGDQADASDSTVHYALEVGTSLWQLYRNLGRLHVLGDILPPEAREESGVREYHRWFSRGVMRWLEIATCRALDMIRKAVDLDTFEPVDRFCNFSSSATDTTGIFHDVKNWWLKLDWPDPDNSAALLAKILEDVFSCGTTYSDLLRDKVDIMFRRHEHTGNVFITPQICVGLNNIERVRRELTNLPEYFGFEFLLSKIRESGSGHEAARQLELTVDTLIQNATDNMESKVNEFIDTVIDKMKPTLERGITESCELQNVEPLLNNMLDPALQLLHHDLHELNFQRFLWRVWEVIISLFEVIIARNTERRRANYFGGVHNILEATLKFFSPDEGHGLDPTAARTQEYMDLKELLESLRMTSEALISKYYLERYEEQNEARLPSKAQLVVTALFTRPGKLLVGVTMAKDMVVESDAISIGSRTGGLLSYHHNQPVDSYVKVQLVPQEWFPTAAICKTKTIRKSDPAVYDEKFEFDLSKTDDGVRAGQLLFTLKDYNLGRSNTFIGEAIIPLSSLPCVDSSEVHTVANTYLKMTTPGFDMGYKSLRALHFRTGDRIASSFIKKVSKRLTDSKVKDRISPRPDDDRLRPKSPNIIDRLKLST